MKQIDSGQSFELKPSEVGKGACPNPIGPFQGEMAKGSVVAQFEQFIDYRCGNGGFMEPDQPIGGWQKGFGFD